MDILTNSPRILQAHSQSRTSQRTDQSLVKELAKPTQDKIVFKKFPTLQKKRNAQPTLNDTEIQYRQWVVFNPMILTTNPIILTTLSYGFFSYRFSGN